MAPTAKYIFFTSEDLVATPMGEMEDFGEICSFELPEMPGSGVTTFSNFYYTNSAKSGHSLLEPEPPLNDPGRPVPGSKLIDVRTENEKPKIFSGQMKNFFQLSPRFAAFSKIWLFTILSFIAIRSADNFLKVQQILGLRISQDAEGLNKT